jgi:GR25 family glycosyltransferase involved in LPS biosynthesis
MTSGEIGCTTSHLKALRHWIETSDSPYAIIMEDDVDLQLVRFGTLLGMILLLRFLMTMM